MTQLRLRYGVAAFASLVAVAAPSARSQVSSQSTPAEDVEQITAEAEQTPEAPLLPFDRPLYQAIQQVKRDLADRHGVHFAIEDTLIYQHTSGGVDPDDAMVNTLGLFATWKIFRDEQGLNFGGVGFQAETRSNHNDEFTDLTADLGTLWAPNDSTSDDYSRINQLWWGQQFADGRLGFLVGKIDPGSRLNANRFAGSGNRQFFSQPFATNPARSFPQNGLGAIVRAEPVESLFVQFMMSDSDAVSNHSPFETIEGRWLYAGEVGFRPTFENLGEGVYRAMLYHRDSDAFDAELGWSLSADQELSDGYGVFLRYGGNDGDINAIKHILAAGLSFLQPFGRPNDQAGVGVSYTNPTDDDDLRDQYSTEAYYRLQVAEGIEISGSAQLIIDPADSDRDAVAVFGLRARVLY